VIPRSLGHAMDELIRSAGFEIDAIETGHMRGPKPLDFHVPGFGDDLIEFRWIEYFRPSLKARGPSSLTWSAKKVGPNSLSKSEIAQGRVIVGTATKRPMISALALGDREIVDAGNAQAH
jgi:hypothetical protein